MTIKQFDAQSEGITLDLAGLVKLQEMTTPEVEAFRKLRDEYRATCTPEETPEVSEETDSDSEDCLVNLVNEIRSALINNPEVALVLASEIKSISEDVKQIGKDFLASTGREVSDGEGDAEKLQEFLDQRDRTASIYKLFAGLQDFVLDKTTREQAVKAGLKVKDSTKALKGWTLNNPNDPSKSADDLAQSKAGRPASNVQTSTYEYTINGEAFEGSRFEMLLQASEGAATVYTWKDLHIAMKNQGIELMADNFTVKMSNGVEITGKKVSK